MPGRASASDNVFVRGLEFEGNHGYAPAERRSTRRFRVDVALDVPLRAAARSDRLDDTIDYWTVCDVVNTLGTKRTFKLIEALAGAIADKLHELYPRAALEITVEKLAPPCPGVPAACGVRLRRPPRAAR